MRHPTPILLLVLTLLAIALTAWPVVDPCRHGDPCCQDDCSPDCAAFCCAGIVAMTATFEAEPVSLDLREAPCLASSVPPTRAVEPPVRPPAAA